MTIRILTDSACDVPADIAARLGILVVPVYINVGEKSYLDEVELTRRAFFEALPGYEQFPTTAAPATGTFTEAYEQLVAEGATEILSVHIAADLSNTYNAARLGAESVQGAEISLWDSQQLALGAGLQAIVAAEAAQDGRSMPEILALLAEKRAKTRIYAMLDTLEFLRRSGRVNWAQFGLGTMLRIKPIVQVYAGEVSIVERIRTAKRALPRLVELVEEQGAVERIAVLYAGSLPPAETLREQAAHLFEADDETIFMEITPAVGAHVGPGAVGLAFISK
jgi:DegV family protein with EDD domain